MDVQLARGGATIVNWRQNGGVTVKSPSGVKLREKKIDWKIRQSESDSIPFAAFVT